MLKHELAAKMQEIDQQLQTSRRQLNADTFGLQASHDFFDSVAHESLIQMAGLKGEVVDKKKDTPLVLQARLITEDEEDDEDW